MDGRTPSTDVLVVGLGLVGAGAVRHLAAEGAAVVGIGPSEPADWARHDGVFASHYDSGRITRKLDTRFEWAELACRAIAEYPRIEADGGVAFHRPVGTVFASTDPEHIAALDQVGRRVGAAHQVMLPGEDVGPRLHLPAGARVVFEPGPAGFVDPRRMLQAQLAAAERHGATLVRDQVVSLERSGSAWRAATASGRTATAPLAILATGAHTDELPVTAGRFENRVRPETVILATFDDDEAARLAGIPSVLAHLSDSSFKDLYQVPPTTYPDGTVRLKLGATLREWEPLATGEARRAWMAGDAHAAWQDELRGLVEDLVPGVRARDWTTKPCLITDTPSGLPTVDHLAEGLVVAAGGNGFAAKSADAIGALAARLVVVGAWPDDVLAPEPFRLRAAGPATARTRTDRGPARGGSDSP